MRAERDVRVLLAEDDEGHAELIADHLREGGLSDAVTRFRNGRELLDFLESGDDTRILPCMVLLDIRMPVMDGVQTLARLKSSERLRRIPVIMLTTTDDPAEIDQCYSLGCNFYVTKPLDFMDFGDTLRRLGSFMGIVRLAEGSFAP